jgi:hypothetical protein
VAAYRRMGKKISTDIRQELNIFKLGENVKEYQQNYLGHILRMATNLLPRKLFDYHPSFRKHQRDGRIISSYTKIGTGLNLAVDDSGGGEEIVGS